MWNLLIGRHKSIAFFYLNHLKRFVEALCLSIQIVNLLDKKTSIFERIRQFSHFELFQ